MFADFLAILLPRKPFLSAAAREVTIFPPKCRCVRILGVVSKLMWDRLAIHGYLEFSLSSGANRGYAVIRDFLPDFVFITFRIDFNLISCLQQFSVGVILRRAESQCGPSQQPFAAPPPDPAAAPRSSATQHLTPSYPKAWASPSYLKHKL